MGNLRSVANAFYKLGFNAEIIANADQVDNADRLILPGVGAFGTCLENLKENGMFEASVAFMKSGKPFLGICVGMQMLFDKSYEYGEHKGFGIFPGDIVRFDSEKTECKIPHMGWNKIKIIENHFLLNGISDGSYMYFVHSYYAPVNKYTLAETEYAGVRFSSFVVKENVAATQFHPEKSQHLGLQILKNFGEWKC